MAGRKFKIGDIAVVNKNTTGYILHYCPIGTKVKITGYDQTFSVYLTEVDNTAGGTGFRFKSNWLDKI